MAVKLVIKNQNVPAPQLPSFLQDPDNLHATAKNLAVIQNLLFQLGGGKVVIEYRGRDLNNRDIMILNSAFEKAGAAPPIPIDREAMPRQPAPPPAAAPPDLVVKELPLERKSVAKELPTEKKEEPISNKDSQKQQEASKSSQEPSEMGLEEGDEGVKDLEKGGLNTANSLKSENKPSSQPTSRGLENALAARSKEAQSAGTRASSSSLSPGTKSQPSGAPDQVIQNNASISLNNDKNGGNPSSQMLLSQNNEKLMGLQAPKAQVEMIAKSEFNSIAMGKNGESLAKASTPLNFNGASFFSKGLEASFNKQQLASSSPLKAASQPSAQTNGLESSQKALAQESKQNQSNPSFAASQTKGLETAQPNPSGASLTSDNKAGAESSKGSQNVGLSAQTQTLIVSSRSELSAALQMQFKSQTTLPLMVMVPLSTGFRKEGSGVSGDAAASSEENKKSKEKGSSILEGSGQGMAFVPEGPTLFGPEGVTVEVDAFLIATTAVTNAQYAFWLNKKNKEGAIFITKGGEIRDTSGTILCKTFEKDPTSQIRLIVSNGELLFAPLKNMDHHPVVQVSWFGAHEFCRDNGLRLPTEVEWEKSAGMHIGEPLRRNRYGCGDEITIASVNYNQKHEKRATPVGFYNGSTVFAQGYNTIQTEHALSPYGCYDMSGNVREWVDERVTKGGSYNSPLEELEVVSHVPLHPHTTDAYTGFRVAIDI